jgi:hypothetical protein
MRSLQRMNLRWPCAGAGGVALHPGHGLAGRIAGGRDRDGLESPVRQILGDARELPVDRLQHMVQHGAER